MPSSKFIFPKNFDVLKSNQDFTIQMAIINMDMGNFTNPDTTYLSAPQQLNSEGLITGHTHFTIQAIEEFNQTTPLDAKNFAFFAAVNNPAVNGVVSEDVPGGLPVGNYKLSSINTAANHQPVLVPLAQHGSLDDAIYFSVTVDGAANSRVEVSNSQNSKPSVSIINLSTPTSTPASTTLPPC